MSVVDTEEELVMLSTSDSFADFAAGFGAASKAYPVDSGSATCCVLNDRVRPVAGTTVDGKRAFAFAISGSVFRRSELRRLLVQAPLAGRICVPRLRQAPRGRAEKSPAFARMS